jgi:DNA recombination protein RmuC
MDLMTLILIAGAAALGYAAGYLLSKPKIAALETRESRLQETEELQRIELQQIREQLAQKERDLSTLQADHRNLRDRMEEKQQEFTTMQDEFRERFENLANRILEEKSKKFTEQNKEKLSELLNPLGERIKEFQQRVEEGQKEDAKERGALKQHLETLHKLNQSMAEEANNLTRALKGDSKKQGNWGEFILQRILERSGLKKGIEYKLQETFSKAEGGWDQPDVVVYLPDEKNLVIDSKVSLKAYEEFVSADDEDIRVAAAKRHITSIKAHIKGLSEKNYQQLPEGITPNFTLLFIPVEPAFGLAIQQEPELYQDAFDRNIIIVSPTTLLATLATIHNVWKQENQNRNAQEIARRGELLYDKFVGFVDSLETVGKRIEQTQKSYDQALNQLHTGRGNLVRQAEQLRDLGVSGSKSLPKHLTGHDDESTS